MATNEWTQTRCANAALAAFRVLEIEADKHTGLFLAVAQLLHLVATGASADMDRACAIAIAADDILTGSRVRRKTHPRVSVKHPTKVLNQQ